MHSRYEGSLSPEYRSLQSIVKQKDRFKWSSGRVIAECMKVVDETKNDMCKAGAGLVIGNEYLLLKDYSNALRYFDMVIAKYPFVYLWISEGCVDMVFSVDAYCAKIKLYATNLKNMNRARETYDLLEKHYELIKKKFFNPDNPDKDYTFLDDVNRKILEVRRLIQGNGVSVDQTNTNNDFYCTKELQPGERIDNFKYYQISPINNGTTRGFCFTNDYIIVARIRWVDGKGCLDIFNKSGKFIKRIVGTSEFFGHGAASDNVYVWTTDYFDHNTVYQFEIETGRLVNKWRFDMGNPIRIEYDTTNNTLLLTAYAQSKVYRYSPEGKQINVYDTTKSGVNMTVSIGNDGYYVLYTPAGSDQPKSILYKYSSKWVELSRREIEWGFWSFDYFQGRFYYDTSAGTFDSIAASTVEGK
jgi:hypothetical protein